jgi:hypothetical protein
MQAVHSVDCPVKISILLVLISIIGSVCRVHCVYAIPYSKLYSHSSQCECSAISLDSLRIFSVKETFFAVPMFSYKAYNDQTSLT